MFHLPWHVIYALYAVHYIALRSPSWVPMQELHEAGGIPPRYGSRILHQLARSGVIEGQRGKGYRLVGDPAGRNILRILEECGGMGWAVPAACPMNMPECAARSRCELSNAWRRGVQALVQELASVTLNHLPSQPDGTPCCPLAEARGANGNGSNRGGH